MSSTTNTEKISRSLQLAMGHLATARDEARRWTGSSWTGHAQLAAMVDQLDDVVLWLQSQRELCEDIDYHRKRDEQPDYLTPRIVLKTIRECIAAGELTTAERNAAHDRAAASGRCFDDVYSDELEALEGN